MILFDYLFFSMFRVKFMFLVVLDIYYTPNGLPLVNGIVINPLTTSKITLESKSAYILHGLVTTRIC
jgi:hypothetical protein